MTISSEKLSAFLDGELPAGDMLEVEQALEHDDALRAELEALMAADNAFKAHFDTALTDPVPSALTAAIEAFEPAPIANTTAPPKARRVLPAAAAVLALCIGLGGGFSLGQRAAPKGEPVQVATRGWLDDIASYHRVYAAQGRHLVEVPAAEAPHIETWLTASVGTRIEIPDLSAQGLTFAGGRLLVAADKPVAQLIYTDAAGAVVALCAIRSDAPIDGLNTRQAGDFDMFSWGAGTANFVLVGDQGRSDLPVIARALSGEA